MQRLPIAAAPRLTEGQESDGIAVIGEGAVWADVQQLQGVCLRETHIPEQSCSYQTHKPDSFVTTTGQKEQSQD